VSEGRWPAGAARLVDAEAAAELLGVPASWLLAQARRDAVPHVRLGRYVRFDPDALEAWWRSRMRGPVADTVPNPSKARRR
jgi:excisionase family DNA binding protein